MFPLLGRERVRDRMSAAGFVGTPSATSRTKEIRAGRQISVALGRLAQSPERATLTARESSSRHHNPGEYAFAQNIPHRVQRS